MKKNNKGFALVETLLVSVLVSGILIYAFTLVSSLERAYNSSFKYNDIDDLYKLKGLKDYINSMTMQDIQTIKNEVDTKGFILISKTEEGYSNISFLENGETLSNIKVENLIFTKANIDDLDKSSFNTNIKRMMKKVHSKKTNYRMIAEFENGDIATITLNLEGLNE